MTATEIAKNIMAENDEIDICSRVDELMNEFVDDGWEDDFDDLAEAYEETGRGGAGSQVLNEVLQAYESEKGKLEGDLFCDVFQELKDGWAVQTD